MGIYHIVVNETRKQWLEPADINDGSIKEGFVLCGVANLTLWLMNNDWHGDAVVVVRDTADHYDIVEKTYKNVTEESINAYNEYWSAEPKHHLKYTPYYLGADW